MKINARLVFFTLVLIAVTTLCKFFLGPDLGWSGFSPVIAIALFSGMIIKEKNISFLLPLIALFASDVIIHLLYKAGEFPYAGFYSGMAINYLILLSATLVGWMLKGRTHTAVFAGAVIAPTVFFLLSNFSVWMGTDSVVYSKDFNGLMNSYIAGLPFYRRALIATLVFLPAIIVLYNVMMKRRTALKLA